MMQYLFAAVSAAAVTLIGSEASQKVAALMHHAIMSGRTGFASELGTRMSETQSGYRLYSVRHLGHEVGSRCKIGVDVSERTLWCELPSRKSLALSESEYKLAISSVLKPLHYSMSTCAVLDRRREACYRWTNLAVRPSQVTLSIEPTSGNYTFISVLAVRAVL